MPWQEARDYVGEKATAAKETLTGKAHETGQAASTTTASSAKEYGALSHCDGWSFVLPLTPQPSYVNSAREGSAGRSKDGRDEGIGAGQGEPVSARVGS